MNAIYVMYVVECESHGKLGEVVSANLGLFLFEGHVKLMEEQDKECKGVCIYPKPDPASDIWAFLPP